MADELPSSSSPETTETPVQETEAHAPVEAHGRLKTGGGNIESHPSGASATYVFGSSSVAGIFGSGGGISNFTPRALGTADLEPEVFEEATNGDGQCEQVAETTAANKVIKIQLVGYITSSFDPTSVANGYSLTIPGASAARWFFVRKVGAPYPKGKYVEVAIDMESKPLITAS